MNNRKLIDYLPPVLKSVVELVAIYDAQQPEIEKAWEALRFVMDNQFIDTATDEGVSVREKELNITPYDTDTLEIRKHRIKSVWFCRDVYTYQWLLNWLKSLGGEVSDCNLNDYTLNVTLLNSYDCIKVLKDIRRDIPSNIIINPTLLLKEDYITIYIGSSLIRTCKISTKIKIKASAGYAYPVVRKCGTYPAQLF